MLLELAARGMDVVTLAVRASQHQIGTTVSTVEMDDNRLSKLISDSNLYGFRGLCCTNSLWHEKVVTASATLRLRTVTEFVTLLCVEPLTE